MEEEQQNLVSVLYSVHEKLRLKKRELVDDDEDGTECQRAWESHTSDHETLQEYSKAMYALATKIWDPSNKSCQDEDSSRPSCSKNNDTSVKLKCKLEWVVHCCEKYFKIEESLEISSKLKLLDVGSCYNPFSNCGNIFNVTAVDLCPAPGFEDSIFRCDFLHLNVVEGNNGVEVDNVVGDSQFKYEEISLGPSKYRQLNTLPQNCFSVVVFSYFLEYLADPKQRLGSCQKAYKLLKPGGLLFILRPDSSKVTPGGNTRLIKMLKLGMVFVGFKRVYFEKLEHLWCMAFKKESDEYIADSLKSSFFKRDIQKAEVENIFDHPSRLHELFLISQDLKEMKGRQEQYDSSGGSNGPSLDLFEELPSFESFGDDI